MRSILKTRQTSNNCHFNFLAMDLIDIKENFSDLMQIYSFLDEIIIKVLKCKQIHKPTLIPYYHGKVKKDCGVSCYSFFDGGYITFHIFEKRRIAYFDIVSNESFDVDKVIKFASKICETKKYNIYTNSTTNEICNKDVFGPHYIASGTLRKQMNINQLLDLQNTIINEINMTPISNPVIVKDGESVRLFIAIAESHISLLVNKKQVKIDVFSCKMFDVDQLKNILKSTMNIGDEILFTRLNK